MSTNYLDFDLLIEPLGDGYRARVLDSPAGQADESFNLPFTETENDPLEEEKTNQ
jgi:hypothetical protein